MVPRLVIYENNEIISIIDLDADWEESLQIIIEENGEKTEFYPKKLLNECSVCGNKYNKGDKICRYCGTEIRK